MPKWHSARYLFLVLLLIPSLMLVGCSDDDDSTGDSGDPGVPSSSLGDVFVQTLPADLGIAWTMRLPDGSIVTGEGDHLLEGQGDGEYVISWPDVEGWRAPNPVTMSGTLDGTNNLVFTGIYNPQPGTCMISTLPAGLDPQWTLQGPSGFEVQGQGNQTLVDLVPGDYTLIPETIDGFTSPAEVAGVMGNLAALVIEAEYTMPNTVLLVNPVPAFDDTPWTITGPEVIPLGEEEGEPFMISDIGYFEVDLPTVRRIVDEDTISVIVAGDYTITWGDIEDWVTPAAETLDVDPDDDEGSYIFSGVYEAVTGTVDISATIGSTSFPWALTDPQGAVLHGTGDATMEGVRAGDYTIMWLDVDGWQPGPGDTGDLASSETLSFSVAADPAISISPMPEGIAAPWSLSGPGGYTLDGVGAMHVEDLALGCYDLAWGEVTGWTAPVDGTLCLDATTGVVVDQEFTRGAGTLFVNLQPASIDADWTVAGPDGFSASGTGQAAVNLGGAGDYTITWSAVDGYMLPAPDTFSYDGEGGHEVSNTFIELLDLVAISGATFTMGSDFFESCRSGFEGEHQVTLTRDYIIMATEVTNAEFMVMAQWAYDRGYVTADRWGIYDNLDGSTEQLMDMDDGDMEISFSDGVFSCINPAHPVKEVSWYGAVAYCDWLSMYRGLPRAYNHSNWQCGANQPNDAGGFRLPTEAEWEFACRGGANTAFANNIDTYVNFFGCQANGVDDLVWYSENSGGWTQEVGQLDANGYGLHDMHGNVQEWVHDWLQSDYYFGDYSPPNDPAGPPSGEERVLRGGYFFSGVENCRSAARSSAAPGNASYDTGFRVVISGS